MITKLTQIHRSSSPFSQRLQPTIRICVVTWIFTLYHFYFYYHMLYSIISVFIIIIFKNCIPLITFFFFFFFSISISLVFAYTVHTNSMILLQDKQGKTHLAKFYVPFKDSEKHNVKYEVGSSGFTF